MTTPFYLSNVVTTKRNLVIDDSGIRTELHRIVNRGDRRQKNYIHIYFFSE